MIIKIISSLVMLVMTFSSHASPVWKVAKNDNLFYIAGTVHVLAEEDYPLPSAFENAYLAADVAVFEADLKSMAKPSSQQRFISGLRYESGHHLYQKLSSATQEELDQYLLDKRIDKQIIASFKPAMVASFLSLNALQDLGVNAKGVDAFFTARADSDQKPKLALETVDQQIAFLAALADGNEDKFISYTLHDLNSMQALMSELKQAWADGDYAFLNHHFVQPLATQFPDIYQNLLVKRNHQWMQSLDAFVETPETEVVFVGAAHLAGNDGLLALLSAQGYDLTPL